MKRLESINIKMVLGGCLTNDLKVEDLPTYKRLRRGV